MTVKGRITDYGFEWGPLSVSRTCSLPDDRLLLTIQTEHRALDVYCSATGRSLRVFEHGGRGELKVEEPS